MGTLKQCHIFRKLRLRDPPDSIPFASVLSLTRKRDFSSRLGTKLLNQQTSRKENQGTHKWIKPSRLISGLFFFSKDFSFTCLIKKFFCNFSRQLVTGKSGHLIQPQPLKIPCSLQVKVREDSSLTINTRILRVIARVNFTRMYFTCILRVNPPYCTQFTRV